MNQSRKRVRSVSLETFIFFGSNPWHLWIYRQSNGCWNHV